MSRFQKVAAVALLSGFSSVSLQALAAPSAEVTLQGILTSTTCELVVNGGKSVLNVGVFNTKVSEPGGSFSAVNAMTNKTVEMPVLLKGCTAGEQGELIIQGITSIGNNEQNVFVAEDTQKVGFMIEGASKTPVKNGKGVTVTLDAEATSAEHTFNVGMATTTDNPIAGAYSAPIVVAYIVN